MPRLSPGIFVNELDFSEFAPALGLARALLMGGATKGPLNTPVFVRSVSELVSEFGEPVLNDFGLQAAVQFLKKGNNCLYLRVADDDPITGAKTASVPINGLSGGTPAVAATGTIIFTGSVNPSDGETITINDGSGAVAATATITFVAAAQPVDGTIVEILDGTQTAATLLITSAGVTPTNGDTITIDDGEGNVEIYEFTTGGGLTVGTIEVDTTGTVTEGIAELVAEINTSGQNITAGAASGPSPFKTLVTHNRPGFGGNAATAANTLPGVNPPTAPPNFSGGSGGRRFEFDSNATVIGPGVVAVTLGGTTLATLANLLNAINAAGGAGEVNVSAADTTGAGDPQATVTHGQPGTVGNAATITTTASPPTVTSPFAGGSNGPATVFEFDDDSTIGVGNIGVLIGATAAATMTNLINAINASGLDLSAEDTTITVPRATLTHGTPGDQGNQTITTTGASIAVTGLSGGTDAVPGSSATVLEIEASSPGTWGNEVEVEITATVVFGAPAGNFDLVVSAPVDRSGVRQTVERFTNLSLDASSDRFIETVLTDGVRGEVDPARFVVADSLVTSGSPTVGTYQLGTAGGTVGADGITGLAATDYVGSISGNAATGLQAARNPDTIEFNILCIPGQTHNSILQAMQSLAETRGDFIFIVDPPQGLTKQEIIDWHNGLSLIVPNAPTQPIDTTYGTLAWSWITDFDDFNQVNIELPPSGFYAAQMAFTDQVAGPWFPVAGFNRGVIDGDAVEFSPPLADRDDLLGGQNRVNPIVEFADTGLVLFGNRTLLRRESLLSNVHVRRLLIHAEKLIASTVRVLVFEPQDPITWKKFENLVNPILANIAANRGLEKFEVIINGTLNPPALRRQKVMRGRLNLTPFDAVEQIEIDFAVFSTGAEFTEP